MYQWIYNINNMGTPQTATYKEYNVLSDYLDIVDRVADLSIEDREKCKAALISCDYKAVYARVKEKCLAKGIAEEFLNELEETFLERFVIYFAEGYAEGLAEARLERARNLKKAGEDINIIAQNTGLDPEVIASL